MMKWAIGIGMLLLLIPVNKVSAETHSGGVKSSGSYGAGANNAAALSAIAQACDLNRNGGYNNPGLLQPLINNGGFSRAPDRGFLDVGDIAGNRGGGGNIDGLPSDGIPSIDQDRQPKDRPRPTKQCTAKLGQAGVELGLDAANQVVEADYFKSFEDGNQIPMSCANGRCQTEVLNGATIEDSITVIVQGNSVTIQSQRNGTRRVALNCEGAP